jgi:Ca2+/Na+ antiporter
MSDNLTTKASELLKQIDLAKVAAARAQSAAKSQEASSKEKLRSDEDTRHSLTFLFLVGFFTLIGLGALFVAFYNSLAVDWVIKLNAAGMSDQSRKITFLELDKVLSLIVSALGTSLGFIIGYYFKNKDK